MTGQTHGSLRFENNVKSFGGTQALKGVSFAVGRGEIVALLGENGAGHEAIGRSLFGCEHHAGEITLAGARGKGCHGNRRTGRAARQRPQVGD